jgi:hypothetical protein
LFAEPVLMDRGQQVDGEPGNSIAIWKKLPTDGISAVGKI